MEVSKSDCESGESGEHSKRWQFWWEMMRDGSQRFCDRSRVISNLDNRLLDKPNKCEMSRRQRPYLVVRKVSPFVYELDFPFGVKIYPVVSIVYLFRYRMYEDPFGRI